MRRVKKRRDERVKVKEVTVGRGLGERNHARRLRNTQRGGVMIWGERTRFPGSSAGADKDVACRKGGRGETRSVRVSIFSGTHSCGTSP